jgi:cysteinyl-tRNA synthetase
MNLRLYNTLTRTKEDFVPLDAKNVRMYVCGPTVYDFAHIGNARPAIVFDVLFRLLRHIYGPDHVTYVRNITDVDDKINARAAQDHPDLPLNQAIRLVTEKTAQQYHADIAALGCLPPTHEPRATEHIASMIAMNERLIAAGHAYAAEGHVLYDVSSKADYGKLARRSLDEMIAGSRVEVAPYKKNPMDFVLWKPSSPEQPGWDSPWGRGRPGWHIECSAMSETLLGETFDIHGGGIDLVFPHHENEIAQSEGAHRDHPLAKVWMHNGFLQVEGEKMSKSLGNFLTIADLLKDWPGEVLRFNMLRTHYRQPIDWTLNGLKECSAILSNWYSIIGDVRPGSIDTFFLNALFDDLNTPAALSRLHAILESPPIGGGNVIGGGGISGRASDAEYRLKASAMVLGLLSSSKLEFQALLKSGIAISDEEIRNFITLRNAARKAKNFKESDRIRDELLAKGIVLKDGPTGTTWEVKR